MKSLRKNKRIWTTLTLLFLFIAPLFAQDNKISLNANNESLSAVLEQIGTEQNIQFAFDATYFSQIKVTLQVQHIGVDEFIQRICADYHLLAEKIDNTYVLYKNPEPIPEPETVYVQISGIVEDASSGEPLLFCHLGFVDSAHKGTTTNDLGVFRTSIEQQNEIHVAISHLGYQRLDTIIPATKDAYFKLKLQPFSIHIEAIQVLQQEKDVIEMGNKTEQIAFNPKQSTNLPRVDDSDLISSLGLIPGISLLGGQSSGISIRGSSPAENLITLDGIPVLETSHLFGNLSVLNSKFISQAFVSRGAFDATYGERVSGVVELKGKNNFYKPSIDFSANLLNLSTTANVPIGKVVSVTGSYRLSYIDRWENYLYKQMMRQGGGDEESTVNPVIQYDDLNFKVGIKPNDKHDISFNFLQSTDLQVRDYEFREGSRFFRYDDADSKNRGFSANWFYQVNPNFSQHIQVGYNDLSRSSYNHSGMSPNRQGHGGKDELARDDNYLEEFSAKWSGELKTGKLTHQAGFGLSQDKVTYDYLAERSTGNKLTDSIVYDTEAAIYHAYLQEKLAITEKLTARIGLRANYTDMTAQFYLQPRVGLQYKLNDQVNLLYAGGLYNQFLTRIRKIDINGANDYVWYLPDESESGILKTQQHLFGVQYENNGWAVNAETYWKKTDGHINIYAEQTGGRDKQIIYNERSGKSDNIGIDLMLQYKHGAFTHILSSSFSKSDEQFENFNNGESYPAFNDQRVNIRWTEMAKLKGFVFASSVYFHSGNPYLISNENAAQTEFDRLPYFLQADVSVVKKLQFKFFNLQTGISFLNILNRENVLEVDYFNVSDSTGSYSVRTDITAMHFTPVFFLNIILK